MQLPTQRPPVLRHRRLHPALGRFADQAGVTPAQVDEMVGVGDDYDDGDDDGD